MLHARHYRDARGFFSYELQTPEKSGVALELRVTYYGGDRGRRFDVLIDDRRIAEVSLDGKEPDRFVEDDLPDPRRRRAPAGSDGHGALRGQARLPSRRRLRRPPAAPLNRPRNHPGMAPIVGRAGGATTGSSSASSTARPAGRWAGWRGRTCPVPRGWFPRG